MPAQKKHGLFIRTQTSLARRNWRIKHLVRQARRVMPWLEPADQPTVRAWAELEIIGAGIFKCLMEQGIVDPQTKQPRDNLLNHLRMYRSAQLAYREPAGHEPRRANRDEGGRHPRGIRLYGP
jgi:hypothetical protein